MGTGFMSGLKAYTGGQWSEFDDKLNARFHDPRAVKFTETWIDMVRDSGPPNWANMQWYDAMEAFTAGQAGMIADADFFAANYEDPKKSKVAGKVGYALIPAGPDGKPYAGLWTWRWESARRPRTRKRPGCSCSGRPRSAPCSGHPRLSQLQSVRASIMNDPRVQEIMGAWGGGSYLKVVAKNLDTARWHGLPSPNARGWRHLGALAARDLLQAHVGGRRAQEGERRSRQGAQGSRHQVAAPAREYTRRRRHWRRERFLPYLLLAPAWSSCGMVYPFGLGLYYSFTSYWLQYPNRFRFVWFDNYLSLLDEPLFARALEFTLGFTLVRW